MSSSSPNSSTAVSDSAPDLSSRIRDRHVGPTRLLTLDTAVDDIASWHGSFLAYPDLQQRDELLQELTVSLLDKGTEARDRFALARVLEDCGAKLNLSSDGLYVEVSGRALVRDLPQVMDVLAEMLRHPAFEPEEFQKAQAQAVAELQRRMEKTSAQATAALTRQLFGPGHPNYGARPEEALDHLRTLSIEDVREYHENHFGSTEWILAVVGDLDHEKVTSVVEDAFSEWGPHDAEPAHDTAGLGKTEAGRTVIPMPDKSNVDVRLGHSVPIRRDHDDYPALYVGNYILGGNFSARLMAEVRDEKGLTYHIGSSLSGVSTRYDGYWQTRVTLSHDALEEGLAETREVIRRFVEDGATQDELSEKKTTITGSYAVGLATTQRLAQSILTNAERGFEMDYMDRFPDEVKAVTLSEVNQAVRTYIRPEALHAALAGVPPEPVEVDGGEDSC